MYANDNASDKIISIHKKTAETVLETPAALLAEDIYSDLFYILEDEGFDMKDPEIMRDLAVIGEMIRAMLYRGVGEYHTYQDFLDQIKIAYGNPSEE